MHTPQVQLLVSSRLLSTFLKQLVRQTKENWENRRLTHPSQSYTEEDKGKHAQLFYSDDSSVETRLLLKHVLAISVQGRKRN